MHWYLPILDEKGLQSELEPIFRTGLAHPSQKPTIMLGSIVLAIGIKFPGRNKEFISNVIDMAYMETALFEAAQKDYLISMERPTVEYVAFSFLLSCYYLSTRQPNLSAITMDATLHAAQSIGLHQESAWGPISFIERQIRRRVWWIVFTGATYVMLLLNSGAPSSS